VLKNLVQGLNIQKLLFNELDDLINDGTILDCVNECFAQLDKELEEEYSNIALFQFSTQLAELFYKGVYGMDVKNVLAKKRLIQYIVVQIVY
jgi:hypothetical protein